MSGNGPKRPPGNRKPVPVPEPTEQADKTKPKDKKRG